MMNGRAITITTLVGLLLAALGIIAPIAWDAYKGRSTLELQRLPSVSLLENRTSSDEIKIFYGDKQIRQLTKVTFALVNDGRTAIIKEHLVTPPTITFDDSEILSAQIEEQKPSSLDLKCEISPDRKSAVLTFPLLNAGDRATVALTVSGEGARYNASARIVNISELTLIDRSSQIPKATFGWSVYVVGFFTAVCALLAISAMREFPKQEAVRRRVRNGSFASDLKDKTKPSYILAVDREIVKAGWTPHEVRRLKGFLDSLPDDVVLTEEQHAQFAKMTLDLVSEASGSMCAFWAALVLGGVGVWYVLSQL